MSQHHTVSTSTSSRAPGSGSSQSASTAPENPLDEIAAVDDPRVDESYCRFVPRTDGADLLLAGVVHDHPASVARVRAILHATTPDVLALELPPASLPRYRQLADRVRSTDSDEPLAGGEMSAAIAAAPDARVVGIDPLDVRFLGSVGGTLLREGHTPETARSVARRTVDIAGRIGRQRLAATGLYDAPAVDDPTEYDCADASPTEQTAHEDDHVARCSVLRNATGRPPAVEVVTTARERRMAQRLRALDGDLAVAVVGWAHLGPLTERLD